tara:strand:+ start:1519 stop:2619 length:1101 start_codon:yes stop_codon:yes gene_type:complete
MSYIGKEPQVGAYNMLDSLTASATASYSLTLDSVAFVPESANHLLVSLNGSIQKAGSSYTVSGSTLTFSSTLASSDSIDFVLALGNVLDIGTPSDATVTKAKTNFVSSGSGYTGTGLDIKGDGSANGRLGLLCSAGTHGVALESPNHSSAQSYTIQLPSNSPTVDKFIKVTSLTGSGATAIAHTQFADAGGTLVEVAQSSISAGSSVSAVEFSNIFSSTYNTYFVRMSKIRFAGDTRLQMRFYSNTGTTEYTGNYYLYTSYGLAVGGGEERNNDGSADRLYLTETLDYDQPADGGATGFFYIDNPLANDNFSVTCIGQVAYRDNSNVWNGTNFNGKYGGSAPRYGFKLYGSSNVEYADITVYGVKP